MPKVMLSSIKNMMEKAKDGEIEIRSIFSPSFLIGVHIAMTDGTKYIAFSTILMPNTINTAAIFPGANIDAVAKYNFDIKPTKSGIPTIDNAPTVKPTPATGLLRPAPLR